MLAGAIDYSADLFRWWAWEIAALARPDGAGFARGPVPPLRLSRAGVSVETPGGDTLQVAPGAAGQTLREAWGTRRLGRVDVVVAPDRHLMRRLSPVRLPPSRIRAMAELDRGASTPLGAAQCHLVLLRPRAADPESRYALIRRDQIDPLLESLRSEGIGLGALVLATPQGPVAADGPSRRAMAPGPRAARAGLAVATALGLAGLVVLPGALAWRQERALAALGSEIARAEAAASGVRAELAARQAQIADLATLRRAKSGALPLIQVLEELARLLPDGTWLESIESDAQGVVFSGTAPAAADLIPRLEASPLFREPTFTEPVLREVGGAGERFTIALHTGRADG